VCAALRDAFSAAGLASVEVVDWTPLASDPELDPAHLTLTLTLALALALALTQEDPAHLHEMGRHSYAIEGTRAYFVQHTGATDAACPYLPVSAHISPAGVSGPYLQASGP